MTRAMQWAVSTAVAVFSAHRGRDVISALYTILQGRAGGAGERAGGTEEHRCAGQRAPLAGRMLGCRAQGGPKEQSVALDIASGKGNRGLPVGDHHLHADGRGHPDREVPACACMGRVWSVTPEKGPCRAGARGRACPKHVCNFEAQAMMVLHPASATMLF